MGARTETPRAHRQVPGRTRACWALALGLVLSACTATGRTTRPLTGAVADTTWARWVQELSEPGGFFDTDNLISNETGYLHVLGAVRALGVRGGAYIGVGPDQNFSYLAEVRPELAFIVDIRRDNLLQHLLFRALFESADTRIEYLSLLHGRTPPDDPPAWIDAGPETLLDWVNKAPGGPGSPEAEAARRAVEGALATLPLALSDADRATILRFHDEFVRRGPALRFTSFGRPPRPYYPTFAQLVLARDLEGAQSSYLADEQAYRFVRELELANRVVPVVGNLAGDHTVRAIGDVVRGLGLTVSAFYASNVEFYLWQDGTFGSYAANVASLPVPAEGVGVLIRSYFPNLGGRHPYAVPGSFSTQTVQTLSSFQEAVASAPYRGYWDLVTRDAVDPRPVGAANR